jgi:hypothetical protein
LLFATIPFSFISTSFVGFLLKIGKFIHFYNVKYINIPLFFLYLIVM